MSRICLNCGTLERIKRKNKGSLTLEIFLYLFFIIPGIFYSIWRLSNRYYVCTTCGSDNLQDINTPVAQNFLSKINGHNTTKNN